MFLACVKFNHVNEFHQKNDVPESFLRNSDKHCPKDFRNPVLAYIALYLVKMKG